MKKIAVVTINYNTEEETHALLESLGKVQKSDFQLEIIVVDNGSKTLFVLNQSEKKDHVILMRSETNEGFSGGNNIGIREALRREAEYILLLNNDTVVDPDMIKNLLEVLESDEKIGLVVPKIYFAKGHEFHKDTYAKEELGKIFWYAGGYTDWENAKSVHRGVDEVDRGQYDKTEKMASATGCCMLFKKEVLEKVGFFDERYFLYYEDADLNERVKKAGYAIFYAPTAVLYHKNAGSTGGPGSGLHDYFLTRNQMLFGMTYAPHRVRLALLRQSLRLLVTGRMYQRKGIIDYYLRKFGKGTYSQ